MDDFFQFDALLQEDEATEPGYMRHFVELPSDVSDQLRGFRTEGTIGGARFRRVIHDGPLGTSRLKFGRSWLADRNLEVGGMYTITIQRDMDPDRVDVCSELQEELDTDEEFAVGWAALSPGKRRTLAHHIERAKRPETRERRARELAASVRAGEA